MRIAVASNLESRDGTLTKDCHVTNGMIEPRGQNDPLPRLRKRPGTVSFSLVKTGIAQLLISWNGIRSVIGDYFCTGYSPSGSYTNSTTWNPADKAANVTLSGGNLTTAWSSAGYGAVRSVLSVSSGLWYFEVTINTLGSPLIGICNATQKVLEPWYDNNYKAVYYPQAGSIVDAIYGSTPAPVCVGGDVVGVLYDATNNGVSFYKNGVYIGSVTGAGMPTGAIFAFVATNGNAATNLTTNFAGAFTYTPTTSATALAVTSGSLPFSGAFTGPTAATQYLMIKNAEFAWTIPVSGTPTKVADVDYPGNMTPARLTVPGIVYLDTFFFVMDIYGRIYNSAADNPTSWAAIDFITAQYENGNGVAIAKSQEYLAAFKDYSVELLYNAGNPVGSPLSRVPSGFFKIGCASGTSLADIKGQIFWISQSKEKGRSVHVMVATNVAEVATPAVQRILNADDLATVYAYGVRLDGHDLYILTLKTSAITLVYDITEKLWYVWSTYQSLTSLGLTYTLTRDGSTATVVCSGAHGLSDGDPILSQGWTQSEYGGIFGANVSSSTTFSYQVFGTPATPATGPGAIYKYTETFFKLTKYTNYQGLDLFLHETDGYLYYADPSVYLDAGFPINLKSFLKEIDGGTSKLKSMGSITLVGNEMNDTSNVRWTDNDGGSYRPYRPINLSLDYPRARRCGSFRRRRIEIRHVGDSSPLWDAVELEVT